MDIVWELNSFGSTLARVLSSILFNNIALPSTKALKVEFKLISLTWKLDCGQPGPLCGTEGSCPRRQSQSRWTPAAESLSRGPGPPPRPSPPPPSPPPCDWCFAPDKKVDCLQSLMQMWTQSYWWISLLKQTETMKSLLPQWQSKLTKTQGQFIINPSNPRKIHSSPF